MTAPGGAQPGIPARLDVELVRRGLARSRDQARELISAGRVVVDGVTAGKPAAKVVEQSAIEVEQGDEPDYVSRAGHKLAGALAEWGGPRIEGRRCLDAGASTGGFTDVLLRNGARQVVAVDVGHDQLVARLRNDPRVVPYDGMNLREQVAEAIGGPVELVVADLSFISLRLVLPALNGLAVPGADFVVLVKPQFEVGKRRLGSGGVVRDLRLHDEAVRGVAEAAAGLGLGVRGMSRSSLPGPAGNQEYLLWLRADAPPLDVRKLADVIGLPNMNETVGLTESAGKTDSAVNKTAGMSESGGSSETGGSGE